MHILFLLLAPVSSGVGATELMVDCDDLLVQVHSNWQVKRSPRYAFWDEKPPHFAATIEVTNPTKSEIAFSNRFLILTTPELGRVRARADVNASVAVDFATIEIPAGDVFSIDVYWAAGGMEAGSTIAPEVECSRSGT